MTRSLFVVNILKASLQFIAHLMNYHANRRILKKQRERELLRRSNLHTRFTVGHCLSLVEAT